MHVKVFVLGRPGSGKSTAARHINQRFTLHGWSTAHINDYDILKQMFLEDKEHRRFRPTANNGFDATDLSVLDIALHEVEAQVEGCFPQKDVVTIEFARDNYYTALRQFSTAFLHNAYILFMDTDLETCIQRVHDRVRCAHGTDDHPSFSDEIFRQYYRDDNTAYMRLQVQREFGLKTPVTVLNNQSSLEDCIDHVVEFADMIRGREKMRVLV